MPRQALHARPLDLFILKVMTIYHSIPNCLMILKVLLINGIIIPRTVKTDNYL